MLSPEEEVAVVEELARLICGEGADQALLSDEELLASGKGERPADALNAVAEILARIPYLAKYIAEALEPFEPPERILPVEPCPRCATGKIHGVGMRKPKTGHWPSCLVMCDTCGYNEGRKC